MKTTIKIKKEVEITTLIVDAGVRYWEDATINGVEDEQGDLVPCREGDRWKPIIDIEKGVITNWTKGVKANIHYKVCDDGIYHLADKDGNILLTKEDYVPDILDLDNESYGDYIIMIVDENGNIENWDSEPNIDDFMNDDNDD
jgi:hypothetical protein